MRFAFLAHEIAHVRGGRFRPEINVRYEYRRRSKKLKKGSPLRRPLADNLLTMTPNAPLRLLLYEHLACQICRIVAKGLMLRQFKSTM